MTWRCPTARGSVWSHRRDTDRDRNEIRGDCRFRYSSRNHDPSHCKTGNGCDARSDGHQRTPLVGTVNSSTPTANVNLPAFAAYFLQARATFTVPSGALGFKIRGEKVKQMRVETANGGGSQVSYILESGKEIPGQRAVLASSQDLSTAEKQILAATQGQTSGPNELGAKVTTAA